LRESVEKTYRAAAQKNASLIENLTGLESIRLYGAESQMQQTWESAVGYISRWSMVGKQLSGSAGLFAGFVQGSGTILIVLVGVHLIAAGEASMGALIACVMLSGRAMGPMVQVASLSTRYNQAKAALEGLQKVMDMPMERNPEKAYLRFRLYHRH
jgi:ATP-binding cassette subfamily C protein LapB